MNTTDWLNKGFKVIQNTTRNDENIASYEKVIDNEYRIIFTESFNKWGGKSLIAVEPLPVLMDSDDRVFHLRAPVIEFFATGFHDYDALEKKIKEEIVPTLKKWALKVI